MNFPIIVPAIKIEQPMATFFAVSLPAEVLLEVSYSDHVKAIKDENGYKLQGTQRTLNKIRLKEISDYIARNDAAFPNSIILAANYHESGYTLSEYTEMLNDSSNNSLYNEHSIENLSSSSWFISEIAVQKDGTNDLQKFYTLTIPTAGKLAAIIDGQHRIFGFSKEHLKNPERLNMELLCSVYLDLPKPYQAEIFSTINSKQKPVDKSLTYELYGYNISDDDLEYLTPDRLAVFFTRKLALEKDSPFYDRIKLRSYQENSQDQDWTISTAAIVEGIMKLISTNPTKDSNYLLSGNKKKKRYSLEDDSRRDNSPLRELYIECEDEILFHLIFNFVKACKNIFWQTYNPQSFITKTVGVQALFDILKEIAGKAITDSDVTQEYFEKILLPAKKLKFDTAAFQHASASGRIKIRKTIAEVIGLKKPE
ncbi:DGQHR domain-containing protein [Acinetobacter nosocomialis]|uniref:DGQHR domain-containing protein n=1 Tax=Acinetobacter TaxID=469 RepID=UPI00125D53C9|nr:MULTISPECIES: DGQHR domain-containing protein [Acinetobacter]MBR7696715.1 DGQHR domain-containing protein [Acinetobacter nosocomialis]MCU4382408.1 DGQHR domain-containing protein [Acinetobacter ursingii]